MGKTITGVVLLILLVAFGIFAGFRAYEALGKNEKNQAGANKKSVVVNMAHPSRKTMLDERRFSGTTNAWSDFDIEPKVEGKLIRLNFDIGDAVKKGELIAKIDDREYAQQVREAEANLEYAKAKLREATGVAKLKQSEFNRRKALIDMAAVSKSDYEQAESELNAQLATAEMCAADVKRYEALLDKARLKLSDTTIYADWRDGAEVRHIGTRYVDEGSLLSVGKPILSIVEISRIKASVQIIERDYPFLSVGQKADIVTDAYPGEIFEGTIMNIGNTLDDKTRSVKAVISIDNKDLRLRPGMFVRCRILLGEHKNALTIPLSAIVQKDDHTIVFQSVEGKAVQTEVRTGLSDGKTIEILSPEIKFPVVTIGNHLLTDGAEIEVSELSRSQMAEEQLRIRKEAAKSVQTPEKAK